MNLKYESIQEPTMLDVEQFLDDDFIAKALWNCLQNNESNKFMEIITARCRAIIFIARDKETDIKSVILSHVNNYKNPTIKTVAKVVHSFEKMHKRNQ